MKYQRNPILLCGAVAAALAPAALAQNLEERLDALEKKNLTLQRQLDALSQDVETIDLGGLVPPLSDAKRGVGQGAAKVYDIEQGLSIGGYGEFLFTQRSGRTDFADAQRVILYFGYKFSDKWVFNSEIEVEHGTTNSGTGEVSLEFGYLDYMHSDAVNFRAGLLLSPLGLVNELHEPTTFLTANRSQTESRIIPTTLREMGAGFYGDVGDFSYRAYAMTSLDGANFSASGLRGGRQRGGKAEADDWSLVTRLDYVGVNGLVVGGSASYGDAGHDNLDDTTPTPNAVPNLTTTILEAHVDYRTGPWQLRALWATANIQDAAVFNASTGNNLADRLTGYYGEVGFDVLTVFAPGQKAQLTPFFRYERIDTQDRVPTGFARDTSQEDEIYTVGVNYKPIPQVVVKVDYENWDNDFDRLNLLFGYVF
ncbi:MAG: hypothetical protein KAI24_07350 [Planctomycetes bacterium]|nr:hypothetical protein [Planctomycetota bacterium]